VRAAAAGRTGVRHRPPRHRPPPRVRRCL